MSESLTALIFKLNSLTSTFLTFANEAAWRNLDTFNEEKNSSSSTKRYFEGNSEARRTEITKKKTKKLKFVTHFRQQYLTRGITPNSLRAI